MGVEPAQQPIQIHASGKKVVQRRPEFIHGVKHSNYREYLGSTLTNQKEFPKLMPGALELGVLRGLINVEFLGPG